MSARPTDQVLAILGYHKIGPPPAGGWETWFYIPEETFAAQLRHLAENGWQVIDLATFLRGLANPGALPRRAALLTFDDGYRSTREVALPWLRRFGYPAVVFVPTGFIGGRNDFDEGNEPTEAICDWDDLHALEREGVAVQSHGVTHRAFSRLDSAEQQEELRSSRAALEAGLGRPVEVFSYPFGDAGPDATASAEWLSAAGYKAACLYGGGPSIVPVPAPSRLPRLAMGPDTDLRQALSEGSGWQT
jgi:peptidoglycan/xylan/chitin deacetylase (PgdA/CDA1 family)